MNPFIPIGYSKIHYGQFVPLQLPILPPFGLSVFKALTPFPTMVHQPYISVYKFKIEVTKRTVIYIKRFHGASWEIARNGTRVILPDGSKWHLYKTGPVKLF